MSDVAPPPPSSGSASGSHTTNMLRNVIVSVTSTVLGASVIYFLGFNHKSSDRDTDDFAVVKEATKQGWDSYVTYENTYTENVLSFEKGMNQKGGYDRYLEGIKNESAKFQSAVTDLKRQKHLDKDLVVVLNRRLENERNSLPQVEENKKNLDAIIASNKSQAEKKQAFLDETTRYLDNYKGQYERAINDIKEIAKTLTARYGEQFAINDMLVVRTHDQRMKSTDSLLTVIRNSPIPENNPVTVNNNPNTTDANVNPVNNNPVNNRPAEQYQDQKTYNNNNSSGINPQNLVGDWSTNNNEIYFGGDGSMEWYVLNTGDNATGTWKFYNNQLYVYATNSRSGQQATWVFNLSYVKSNSFTITLSVPPYNIYNLVRIRE